MITISKETLIKSIAAIRGAGSPLNMKNIASLINSIPDGTVEDDYDLEDECDFGCELVRGVWRENDKYFGGGYWLVCPKHNTLKDECPQPSVCHYYDDGCTHPDGYRPYCNTAEDEPIIHMTTADVRCVHCDGITKVAYPDLSSNLKNATEKGDKRNTKLSKYCNKLGHELNENRWCSVCRIYNTAEDEHAKTAEGEFWENRSIYWMNEYKKLREVAPAEDDRERLNRLREAVQEFGYSIGADLEPVIKQISAIARKHFPQGCETEQSKAEIKRPKPSEGDHNIKAC